MKLDYIVFFIVCWCVSAAPSRLWTTGSQGIRGQIKSSNQRETLISERIRLPDYTKAGYLDVNKTFGSDMYYIYYEAQDPIEHLSRTPIVLWLQGGPGCTSLFGMLYINGPYWVNEDDLTLRSNPGSWNRMYGMLFIEQPIGTGFSRPGKQAIPNNEEKVAADLYKALNNFYRENPSFSHRPLVVAGESYAGKYVPSISHYILQAKAQAEGGIKKIRHARDIGQPEPPLFTLGGMAIGNGWTDADTQQLVQGTVAWSFGLIDGAQRRLVDALSEEVVDLIKSKQWNEARKLSDHVNEIIANASGVHSLMDVRRNIEYDGFLGVDRYLNQTHVRKHLKADLSIPWESCSDEVDRIMGADVMKSVKGLVADILDEHPVLLYQGQFDVECGVASNDAWIQSMAWHVNRRVLGVWKQHATLTQLVIRNTGHMVPHDHPYYGQLMIERWVEEAVLHRAYNRMPTEEEEQLQLRIRGSDAGQWAGPA